MKSTQTTKPKTIKLISYSFDQTSYSKCYKSQCHPTEENVWWYFLIERCYQCHVLYKVQYSVTVRNKKQQIWSVIHNCMKIVSKGVAFVNIFVRWWLRKREKLYLYPHSLSYHETSFMNELLSPIPAFASNILDLKWNKIHWNQMEIANLNVFSTIVCKSKPGWDWQRCRSWKLVKCSAIARHKRQNIKE